MHEYSEILTISALWQILQLHVNHSFITENAISAIDISLNIISMEVKNVLPYFHCDLSIM